MVNEILGQVNKEAPTIEQTIKTFSVAADMFLAGKELAMQRLNVFPFVPSLEEFGEHIAKSTSELTSLTEWQRSFLLVNGVIHTYSLIARRAEYQRKFERAPEIVTVQLLDLIRRASDGQLKFRPNRVKFKWSLFSNSLVLPEQEFKEAATYQFDNRRANVLGFIGFFATELGRMPFVLAGREGKETVWHEDIHVFREEMGLSATHKHDMGHIVQMPSILRATDNVNIEAGDLDINEKVLDEILGDARLVNREELAASLWAGEMPVVGTLDFPKEDQDLSFIHVNLLNCIYAPATGLDEAGKLQRHFQILSKISTVNLERTRMFAVARQGMNQYKGTKNRWGWAAARATVLHPHSNPRLFQAITLGSGVNLQQDPKSDKGLLLAATLATHARRSVLSDAYGQGGDIPNESVSIFWDTISTIINSPRLYSKIIETNKLEADEILSMKRYLIKFAEKSVPQGSRGATKRELEKRLSS